MIPSSTSRPPFIIWTLQRTGGTNLTARLVELSGLNSAPHEPFNYGRIYGSITAAWVESNNRAALDLAIAEVVAKGEVIKHCVETVPWEITESLARAASGAGYRHLFLYRKEPFDRLLSLHFARSSGVWGPSLDELKALTGGPELRTFETKNRNAGVLDPLPVEDLLNHERRCVVLLKRVWGLLVHSGATPAALAYEDVYRQIDLNEVGALLKGVLNGLGLGVPLETFSTWVKVVVGKGDQGTRDLYKRFPGYSELWRRCEGLPRFLPGGKTLYSRALAEDLSWLECVFIDVYPSHVLDDETFEVGGVCVLAQEAPDGLDLVLRTSGCPTPVHWKIESPRMAVAHPKAKNSRHARWRGECRLSGVSNFAILELTCPQGTSTPILEILVQPDEAPLPSMSLPERLVFDIGSNDGADTAYYLQKGFRVVAVEAIPALVDILRDRFADAVADGRLVVEHAAIHARSGAVELLINPDRTEWSSARGASKAKSDASMVVEVPSVTLADLIKRHGRPHYIKIDIEGGELDAVLSLGMLEPGELPAYISFELNPQVFEVLENISALGYKCFQIVRQGAPFLPPPVYPCLEGRDYRVPWTWNMSGAFGRDLPASRWIGIVPLVRQIIELQDRMRTHSQKAEDPGWYDIHCSLG